VAESAAPDRKRHLLDDAGGLGFVEQLKQLLARQLAHSR
jgi:hypothetical protein